MKASARVSQHQAAARLGRHVAQIVFLHVLQTSHDLPAPLHLRPKAPVEHK